MIDRRRTRRLPPVILPLVLFLLLALGWTALWFHAASVAQAQITAWRAREEQLGRIYSCASQAIGGYPFRIEVHCADPGAQLRSADPPFTVNAKDLLVVAQVYQPTLLIAEVAAPLTLRAPSEKLSLVAEWTLAQTSVRGLPPTPERVSVALDQFRLDRAEAGGPRTLMTAKHLELHARLKPGSAPERPVLDLAARLADAASPDAPMPQPIDLELTGVLRGLKDLTPRPVPVLLRQLQETGGRLELSQVR